MIWFAITCVLLIVLFVADIRETRREEQKLRNDVKRKELREKTKYLVRR